MDILFKDKLPRKFENLWTCVAIFVRKVVRNLIAEKDLERQNWQLLLLLVYWEQKKKQTAAEFKTELNSSEQLRVLLLTVKSHLKLAELKDWIAIKSCLLQKLNK